VHQHLFSPHVGAAAEALFKIYEWRTRVDVQANTILERHLDGANDFHAKWPCILNGVDKYGHVIFSERVAQINTTALMTRFTINDILLLRTQVQEQFQRSTVEEGARRSVMLGRHTHLIDLAGTSLFEFYRVSSRLKPLFGLLQEQYPGREKNLSQLNT
jgi:hypothetical protein